MAKSTNKTQQALCIKLSKELTHDLKMYANITGKAVSRVIAECLEQRLMPLRDHETGMIRPVYGQFRTNPSDAPQMCYVLNETTMYGEPYYTIYFDGNIRSVPREQVATDLKDLKLPLDIEIAAGEGEEE